MKRNKKLSKKHKNLIVGLIFVCKDQKYIQTYLTLTVLFFSSEHTASHRSTGHRNLLQSVKEGTGEQYDLSSDWDQG